MSIKIFIEELRNNATNIDKVEKIMLLKKIENRIADVVHYCVENEIKGGDILNGEE